MEGCFPVREPAYPLVFVWASRFGGKRKGHRCRILGRAPRMNTVLVEWESGGRDLVSGSALRRASA